MEHLTEEERQTMADGSMPPARAAALRQHLETCDACAQDVSRLERLMQRISNTPVATAADAPLDALWPDIRARIELKKVVALGAPGAAPARSPWRRYGAGIGIAAAALILATAYFRSRPATSSDTVASTPADTLGLMIAVTDSVHTYEDEARALLNRLEVQRAMLRPETVASIDRDLKTIDTAIAELKVAIANDPKNPALRQLLALSYRQKVDVLKRATNAG